MLFAFSFFFNKLYSNRSSVAQEVRLAEKYLHKQEQDFATLTSDTALVNKLLKSNESLQEFEGLAAKPYGFFLYSQNEFGQTKMKFWSDQLNVPPPDLLASTDGDYFIHLSNGWYYCIRKTLPIVNSNGKVISCALIPVRSEFFIETDYLPKKFAYSSTADKRVLISKKVTEFPVKSASGTTLFYLEKKTAAAVPYNDTQTIFLRFGALIFLFLFLHLLADSVARKHGAWKGIGALVLLLLAVRLTTYYYPSLLNLRQFELFDPSIYGSNPIQRSLGDLLINSLFLCWVVLFAWSKLREFENPAESFSVRYKWVAGIFSLCLLLFSTFVLATVIRSLVSDSTISFDVTDFFSLNFYTVAGFAALACLSLSYYYLSQLLFRFIFPLFKGRSFLIYFAIGFAGLIYLTIRSGNSEVLFYLPVLLWLLVYTWFVNRRSLVINHVRINIAGTLSWIFVFSVSIAAIMLSENGKVEWEKRKRLADKLAIQTDPSSERLMSIAIKYLDNDFLSENFHRFKDEERSVQLRDSIITGNYSGYLNKYDTRLYVYDESDRPLFNEDPTSFEALNVIFTVQSKPTEMEGLYYYETSFDKFNYIIRRDVVDTANSKLGSFFIHHSLRTVAYRSSHL